MSEPFDVLTAPLTAPRPQQVQNSGIIGSNWSPLMSERSAFGLEPLSEHSALTISAVYACVNLIAGAISAIPLMIYGRRIADGERSLLANDPLWWMLNEEMAPRWSAAVGWEFGGLSLLLGGDMFIEIVRDRNGNAVGLEPIHHLRVTVFLNTEVRPRRLVYMIMPEPWDMASGGPRVLDQDDMLHVPGLGFNGLRGLSPLRHALRNTGAVAQAAQEYSARFFANSARPDYVLKAGAKLDPSTIERLRNEAAEKNSRENAHKPMVLDQGMDFQAVTMSAEDVQLIATRNFQIEEIARIYGVPPFMVGHNEKTTSWGSGVEAMGTAFVRYTLKQHLNKIETELNRKLIRTAAKVIEFDTFELERADMTSLFTAFRQALGQAGQQPFMTVEEIRQRLRLNKIGDLPQNPPAPPAPKEPNNAPQTA